MRRWHLLYVHFPHTREPPNAQPAPVKLMQGRTAFLKYKLAHTAEIQLLASCYNGTFSFQSGMSVNTVSAGICCAVGLGEQLLTEERQQQGQGLLVLCLLPTGKWELLAGHPVLLWEAKCSVFPDCLLGDCQPPLSLWWVGACLFLEVLCL